MNKLNAVLTSITDAIFSLLTGWPPILVLIGLSVVVGVLMAIVFRYTSRQQSLRRVADLSRAQVLAIKLFKDDLGTLFVSMGRLFRYTALRLWYSLPPALVMFVPFILLLTQVARWYEHRPLVKGETAVLEIELDPDAWPRVSNLQLEVDDGIQLADPPHHDPTDPIISWNVTTTDEKSARVRWKLEDQRGEKRIGIADSRATLCAQDLEIPSQNLWHQIISPGEPAFGADSDVKRITLHVVDPYQQTPLFGFDVPWWLTLLIVSMAAAFLVRPLVKVQF